MQIVATTGLIEKNKSLDFYRNCGWTIHEGYEQLFVSDKGVILELNPDKKARKGIKFYGVSQSKIDAISEIVHLEDTEDSYVFVDPSGCWIYCMKNQSIPNFKPQNKPSILGTYSGVSIECIDVKKAIAIYTILGFEPTAGNIENGWQSFQSPCGFTLSIMKAFQCPHSFTNPSFTYFNSGRNKEIIDEIIKKNIRISEEITVFNDKNEVDNIIIHEPGGYGFFIFND